jgi:large subunit ribosomal protein L4
MIEIPVYKLDGSEAGSIEVDEALLGGEVRPALLKQAYVAMHANRRQGSAANRNRSLKHGSSRKLFRQKGTGRARRGNVRTNLLRGGGVAFNKRPRTYRQSMPTKMRRLANRNALLSKCVDGEIKVVETFGFKAPKTSEFAKVLGALSIDRACLLAVEPEDVNTALSARNVPDVTTVQVEQLNAFDLLNHRYLLLSKAALEDYLAGLAAKANGKEAA